MDWNNEVDNLSEGIDFLKLGGGTHKVKFCDNGTPKDVQYDGKTVHKVFFKVRHLLDNEEKEAVWTVTKSEGLNSLFGQIALIGRNIGSLIDQVVTVIVKGEGKQKDYTVVEAVDLIKKEIERKKSLKVTTEKIE